MPALPAVPARPAVPAQPAVPARSAAPAAPAQPVAPAGHFSTEPHSTEPHSTEPSSTEPRCLPLDAWLGGPAAHEVLSTRRTALRDMAWNVGQVRGLAAVAAGSGIVLLGGAALAAANGLLAAAVPLALVGAALQVVARAVRRSRAVRGIPSTEPMTPRSPETVRTGIGHAIALSVLLSLPLLAWTTTLFGTGAAETATAITLHLLVVGQAFCLFTVPSVFVQHARRDFRAAIAADPARHRALDQMAQEWVDPHGVREFGPL